MRYRHHRSRRPLNILVGFFCVAMVLFGTIFYWNTIKGQLHQWTAPSTTVKTPSVAVVTSRGTTTSTTLPMFLFRSAGGRWIGMNADGQLRNLTMDEVNQSARREWIGARIMDGVAVPFTTSSAPMSDATGIWSSDGTYSAKLLKPSADDASIVEFSERSQHPRSVTLRIGSKPVRDARLLTWVGDSSVLLMASGTSTPSIFQLSRSGTLSLVSSMPDQTLSITGQHGSVWAITATQGEGLESPPIPPSTILRIRSQELSRVMTSDPLNVIQSVLAGPGDAMAWRTDDGQAVMKPTLESAGWFLGKKKPLLFLSERRLLLQDGSDLWIADAAGPSQMRIGTIPDNAAELFAAMSTSTSRVN